MTATLVEAVDVSAEVEDRQAAGWHGMYRAGGVCLVLTGAIYLIGAVLSNILGPAPSSAELYMNAIAKHIALSRINFGIFTATDFLLIPGILAIYLLLKERARSAMLLATGLMMLFIVLDLAITELNSLTLVSLTERYVAALNDAQRAASLAAANYALATLPLGTFYSYELSSIGLLVISAIMWKSVIGKATTLLGIVAGIEGVIGGFYVVRPVLAILLIPSLIAFGLWCILAGVRVYRVGRTNTAAY